MTLEYEYVEVVNQIDGMWLKNFVWRDWVKCESYFSRKKETIQDSLSTFSTLGGIFHNHGYYIILLGYVFLLEYATNLEFSLLI